MLTFGLSSRPTPGHDHGLLQQQELRLGLHAELLGHRQELPHQPAERDLLERQAEDRLTDRAHRLDEGHPVGVVGQKAGGEEDVRHLDVVALQKAHEDVGHVPAVGHLDPAHDAEIEATMVPSRSIRILPGCMSPWKKPSLKTWLKKAPAAFSMIRSGSCPAAISAARSAMPWPTIRSKVTTRRPVRRQSTAGTRKPS
ncbi:MAG: hypothetical protein R3C69_14580 [Geminicoccaceae bacterium]